MSSIVAVSIAAIRSHRRELPRAARAGTGSGGYGRNRLHGRRGLLCRRHGRDSGALELGADLAGGEPAGEEGREDTLLPGQSRWTETQLAAKSCASTWDFFFPAVAPAKQRPPPNVDRR